MARRRFPPPWSVEEYNACFIVRDHGGQAALRGFRTAPSNHTGARALAWCHVLAGTHHA